MNSKKLTLLIISIPWILFLLQGYYLAIFGSALMVGLMILTVLWGIIGVVSFLCADLIYDFLKGINEGDTHD